jgi:hypothetical protein
MEKRIKRRIGALVILGMLVSIALITPVQAPIGEDWYMRGNDAVSGDYLGTNTEVDLDFYTYGNSRMVLTSNGDLNVDSGTLFVDESESSVGIGDTSPDFKLEVTGSSGSGYFGVTSSSDGDVFKIGSNGWVGIGQSTPLSSLHIKYVYPGIILEPSLNAGDTDFWMGVNTDCDSNDDDYFQIGDGTYVLTNPFVTIDTNGKVGIGAIPNTKLEVVDTSTQLRLSYAAATTYTNFEVDVSHNLNIKTSSSGQIKLQPTTDSTGFFQVLEANTASPVLVADTTNERVGIGTLTPGATLDVRGDAIFNEEAGDNDFRIESVGENDMFFVDASTDHVGIGTSTPDAPLHILYDGAEPQSYRIMSFGRTIDTPTDNMYYAMVFNHENDNDEQAIYAEMRIITLDVSDGTEGGAIAFHIANGVNGNQDEAMRIVAGGKVGIGDTSPDRKLHITETGEDVPALKLECDTDTDSKTAEDIYVPIDINGVVYYIRVYS